MSYETFTAIDFALDERFRQWVLSPTAEADAFWASFLTRHPDRQAAVTEARLLVSRLRVNAETATPERLQQLWERIRQETQHGSLDTEAEPTGRVVPLWGRRPVLLRWAAVWGGLLLLAGLAYYRLVPAAATTYQTAYGETKTVTLPDGSRVTLNGNSTLTLPGDWTTRDEREVQLQGEAFFAVTKQKTTAGQPVKFRVLTTDLRIDVLGTRFNVNHRRHTTEVVLQEGRVQVSREQLANGQADSQSTVMQPGEMVTYSEATRNLTKALVDVDAAASWQDKLLIFRDKPIAEIVRLLSDTYGIQVDIRNQDVANRRFSGSVPTDSVAVFFQKLQKLYGVSVRQEGQRYVVE